MNKGHTLEVERGEGGVHPQRITQGTTTITIDAVACGKEMDEKNKEQKGRV